MGRSCCDQQAPPSLPKQASAQSLGSRNSPQKRSQSTENVISAPYESRTSDISMDTVNTSAGDCCPRSEEDQGESAISCADQCCENKVVCSGTQRDDSGPSNKIDGQSCTKGVSSCCGEDPIISATNKTEEPPFKAETTNDSCCGPKPLKQRISAGSKPDVTDCCRGKKSPCCDEACLDRLALRKCQGEQPGSCTDPRGRCMLP